MIKGLELNSLRGKTVLVTGGSGFVGGRLVESLILDHGVKVRALVHRASSAVRLARFDIDLISADMLDLNAMKEATKGCDVVFHLAFGKQGTPKECRATTVESTRALCAASVENKVGRFVYVSTSAVYGTPGTIVNEESPRGGTGWEYADSKYAAEEVALGFHRDQGLASTVVQLSGVYGPFGGIFTATPLMQLKNNRVVLANNGEGVSNATYVDDTVQGILRAAVHERAPGEIFIIRGPGRVTRREIYECFQRMLGTNSIVNMSTQEIRSSLARQRRDSLSKLAPSALRALKESKQFRDIVRNSPLQSAISLVRNRLPKSLSGKNKSRSTTNAAVHSDTENKPLLYPDPTLIKRLGAQTEFDYSKAQRLIGYEPQFDLQKGMALTEQWARWAGLIPTDHVAK